METRCLSYFKCVEDSDLYGNQQQSSDESDSTPAKPKGALYEWPTCSPICQRLRNSGEKFAPKIRFRCEFLERNLCEALC